MYSSYYGFREDPFSLLPDPDFLFLSQKHETALNLLELAILNQSAFSVISGEIGTGKTTLIRALLNRLDSEVCVGLISNTHADFSDLLSWVVSAYGLEVTSRDPVALYQQFSDFVCEQYAQGKHTLLIIDEAQNLSVSALEELRMLSNINSASDAFFQIILVGQTGLIEKLQQPELAQLTQRVSVFHNLPALSEIETEAYIQHRLRTAGGSADLFDSRASRQIYRFARGIPRLINKLCDLCLVYGFSEELPRIGADIVRSVVRELKPMGVNRAAEIKDVPATPPPIESAPRDVGLLPVKRNPLKNATIENKKDDPQRGDKTMKAISEEHPSHETPEQAQPEPSDTDGVAAADAAEKDLPVTETGEDVHAAALTAAEEKAEAERTAEQAAAVAKAAIEKAAADLAALEAARAEKIKADKLAADKAAADRMAITRAAEAVAAADQAKVNAEAADKRLLETQAEAETAAEQLARVRQSTDSMVAEQLELETAAKEKAALAARLAEEAVAAAEAAASEAQQALLDRTAAEKLAAEKLGAAQKTAEESAAERDNSQQVKIERVAIEQEAVSKADAARIAAEDASREKSAAVRESQEKRSTAKQAAKQAELTRAAAEKAAAELEAAEKIAAEKETREKIALAKVAASIAAQAQKEAEEAAAAQAAALEVARRKQAIAQEAARKAAEASLAVKKDPDVVPTTVRVSELVKTTTSEEVPAELVAKQHKSRPGRTWFLMTLTAVIAGGSGWLAYNRIGGDGQAGKEVMAGNNDRPSVSAAALEVKKPIEK